LNRDTKTTIILVTHDPNVSAQAQRIIHLRDGTIEEAA
jgi:putative ABC transport system ATP-binding protein